MTEDDKNQFHLRFLSIPTEVFLNKKLDKTCILLFQIINMLDNKKTHCFASNDYLASLLNGSPHTISLSIATLIEQGYIEKVSFDGRVRILRVKEDYLETWSEMKHALGKWNNAPSETKEEHEAWT